MTDFNTTPILHEKRSKGEKSTKTMTYREWLIGKIASGSMGITYNKYEKDNTAKDVIEMADEIIKQLDDEQ